MFSTRRREISIYSGVTVRDPGPPSLPATNALTQFRKDCWFTDSSLETTAKRFPAFTRCTTNFLNSIVYHGFGSIFNFMLYSNCAGRYTPFIGRRVFGRRSNAAMIEACKKITDKRSGVSPAPTGNRNSVSGYTLTVCRRNRRASSSS